MALTLAEVVGQFKAEIGRTLSADFIERVCDNVGHVFRKRVLDPVTFVHTFLLQMTPGTPLPKLIVNPLRPCRVEPRVLKRRKKEYTLMRKPRAKLRKALAGKRHAA